MKFISTLAFISLKALPFVTASIPIVSEYAKLFKLCQDGGVNSYVGVRYQGDYYNTFNFNQCYPYEINGNLAEMAVFCKSVTCYSNPNPDCTGGAVPPVPVPLLAGLTLINALDFVQLLGQGATCQKTDSHERGLCIYIQY